MGTEDDDPAKKGLSSVLIEISRKLDSPPLLFALGVLVVLATIASLLIDDAQLLIWAFLLVVVVALISWIAGKFIDNRKSRSIADVDVRATKVGEKGRVTGIEGLPPTPGTAPPTVAVKAEKIDGHVSGAKYNDKTDNQS